MYETQTSGSDNKQLTVFKVLVNRNNVENGKWRKTLSVQE